MRKIIADAHMVMRYDPSSFDEVGLDRLDVCKLLVQSIDLNSTK